MNETCLKCAAPLPSAAEKEQEVCTHCHATEVRSDRLSTLQAENRGGCGKPEHITSTGDEGTSYCLVCELEANNRELRERIVTLEQENGELNALFEMQRSRVDLVTQSWQQRHNRPDVLPDLGDLIDWMWGECKVAASQVEEVKDESEAAEARMVTLEQALKACYEPLQAISLSVEWELCDQIKRAVSKAVELATRVLADQKI